MKTPPNTNTPNPDRTSYLYGDQPLVGYADKVFFELFANTCYSDKIYSVQVADFPSDLPAVIYLPEKNKDIDWDSHDGGNPKAKHIFVQLSPELIEFLAERGVEAAGYNWIYGRGVSSTKGFILNRAWVLPSAFHWKKLETAPEDEDIVVDPYYPHPEDDQQEEENEQAKASKTKAIIATGIALIALLN